MALLPQLKHLRLDDAQELPECIGGLEALTRLDICTPRGPLAVLPSSLSRLRQLRVVEMGDDASLENMEEPTTITVDGLDVFAELPALQEVLLAAAFLDDLDWLQASGWSACQAVPAANRRRMMPPALTQL